MRTMVLALLVAVGLAACGGNEKAATDAGTDLLAPEDIVSGDAAPETVATPIDWDAVFAQTDWTDDGMRRLVILHTNDLHSHHNGTGPLADFSPDSMGTDATLGGFARIATRIKQVRSDLRPGADLLVLDAGDFSFGSAFAALAPEHGTELKFLTQAGYTATTLGNHELDWTPKGLAQVLEAGLADDGNLSVLASNLVFSDEDDRDDDLAALLGSKLHRYRVVETDNGLRIGLFGVVGKGAYSLAPKAEPLEVRAPAEAAAEMVAQLRDVEGVDLVICLSHSGVGDEGETGEDEKLAQAVDGIDVIVGGHTHTLMPEPKVVNNTIVVQAGCYGAHLGHLVLVESEDGFVLESWTAPDVDDELPGLTSILELVASWEAMLDSEIFAAFEHGYRDVVAAVPFDLPQVELAESALGDLVTDAIVYGTGLHGESIDVALEANGVIREGMLTGEAGKLQFGDLVRVLPIGIGTDLSFGYPMCDFYLTPHELKLAAEVTVGIAPMVADSFYLQFSGMRVEYDPEGKLLEQVTAIYLGNDVDGYATTSLDLSPENQTLYHVAANLYLGEMLAVLKELTAGKLAIEPKDADGAVYADIHDMLTDADAQTPGLQEYKVWRALYDYLRTLPVDESTGLPTVPSRYSKSAGRIVAK